MKAEPKAAALRIGYVLLAHEPHGVVVEVVRALLAADPTGLVYVHYDAKAAPSEFERLRAALADAPRVVLLERRAASGWGQFGLVQACLNAFDAAFTRDDPPDFFHLMSASCAPIHPIAAFRAFLAERRDQAFIECEGPEWIVGGLREERYTLYHLFNERAHREAFYWFVQIQRLFRIRRRVPIPVAPRFGSQWWTLPRDFVIRLREEIGRNPALLPFFRKVWIPDEMFFQTMVYMLHNRDLVTGYNLTYYKFTNQGKPIVFYDDHLEFLKEQGFFFARKISPGAKALRAALWRRASAPDAAMQAPPERVGRKPPDYEARMRAQSAYPAPGRLFYGDQLADDVEGPIRALRREVVAVWTLDGQADALTAALAGEFRALRYEAGPPASGSGPLSAEAALRTISPTLAFATRAAREKAEILVLGVDAPLELLWKLQGSLRVSFVAAFPCLHRSWVWMPALTAAGATGFRREAENAMLPPPPSIDAPPEAALDELADAMFDWGFSQLLDDVRAKGRLAPGRLVVDRAVERRPALERVEALVSEAALIAELEAGLSRLPPALAEAALRRVGLWQPRPIALERVGDVG